MYPSFYLSFHTAPIHRLTHLSLHLRIPQFTHQSTHLGIHSSFLLIPSLPSLSSLTLLFLPFHPTSISFLVCLGKGITLYPRLVWYPLGRKASNNGSLPESLGLYRFWDYRHQAHVRPNNHSYHVSGTFWASEMNLGILSLLTSHCVTFTETTGLTT